MPLLSISTKAASPIISVVSTKSTGSALTFQQTPSVPARRDWALVRCKAFDRATHRHGVTAEMFANLRQGVWINEQVKLHQRPLRLRGEGWGEGIANEPAPAHPSISTRAIRPGHRFRSIARLSVLGRPSAPGWPGSPHEATRNAGLGDSDHPGFRKLHPGYLAVGSLSHSTVLRHLS